MINCLRICDDDNVAVALRDLRAGENALGILAREGIMAGHKMALADIPAGARVIKYGAPIGVALRDIPAGAWVHTHNLQTALGGAMGYTYHPAARQTDETPAARHTFMGYPRADGRVGIRNEIWLLPTVGCVNGAAENIALRARAAGLPAYAFPHPYGCSQLGDDLANTQRLLAALCRHPNAGGALVLGLGCENNHLSAFRAVLGDVDDARVRFLNAQDVIDEEAEGLRIVREIGAVLSRDARAPQPLSRLTIGLKCGGSDGFSGITANPLLGAVSDWHCARGGSALLTEAPEMFGAEQLLMDRCADRAVFEACATLINDFKDYFIANGQPVSENPSPGNKAGGITTLEEKSLGCTQKGGAGPVVDVLPYAAPARRQGLSLVWGPGNDLCAVTALAGAGAQLLLFTTGRGTPFGSPVPTLKISTNTALAQRKPAWIDFDAGALLSGTSMESLRDALIERIADTASGAPALNERHGHRGIAIFKSGVTV